MRYQVSSHSPPHVSLHSAPPPRGRATPFFRLRLAQRHKGMRHLRFIHLLSVKNFTLLLVVFAFMLMWMEQTGFAPSLDLAASQLLTPTTQHILNLSDTLFSNSQYNEGSNGTDSTEKVRKYGTREATTAPLVSAQMETKPSAISVRESYQEGSKEQTKETAEDTEKEPDSSSVEGKGTEENTGAEGDVYAGDNHSEDAQNIDDTRKESQSEAQNDVQDDTQNEKTANQESEELSDIHEQAGEANSRFGKGKGESNVDDTEGKENPESARTQKSLEEELNFTPATAINFMHFHKTGGVSFKTSLHKFYFDKIKGNGEKVSITDACYSREGVQKDPSKPSFLVWRCDWDRIRDKDEKERNKLDFTFGHQFWGNGIGELLNQRDVRSFTIMRHPFDRKVSFYFHFFVREVGRKEEDVTYEEIRDFLLYDKLIIKADLGRDLGPNYMAGRLLSDGVRGFVGNGSFQYYEVDQNKKYEVSEEALKLVRKYLFVGLQVESGASKCMLKKVVKLFNQVNGVDNGGLEVVDDGAQKLNSGSYSLNAARIWSQLSAEEKVIFDRKERVDILIYEEGERLFKEQVKQFGCTHRLESMKYKL